MNDSQWVKLNVALRFIMLGVLVWVGLQVLWYHYGYQDPDDSKLIDKIGRNVTCKQAFFYYAENALGLWNASSRDRELKIYNVSEFYNNLNISKVE